MYSRHVSTSSPGRKNSTRQSTAIAVASQPVQLLAIHSANVTPMMPSTFQSSASSRPTARPFSSMQAMVAAEMGSGRNTSVTDSQHAASSTSATKAVNLFIPFSFKNLCKDTKKRDKSYKDIPNYSFGNNYCRLLPNEL